MEILLQALNNERHGIGMRDGTLHIASQCCFAVMKEIEGYKVACDRCGLEYERPIDPRDKMYWLPDITAVTCLDQPVIEAWARDWTGLELRVKSTP